MAHHQSNESQTARQPTLSCDCDVAVFGRRGMKRAVSNRERSSANRTEAAHTDSSRTSELSWTLTSFENRKPPNLSRKEGEGSGPRLIGSLEKLSLCGSIRGLDKGAARTELATATPRRDTESPASAPPHRGANQTVGAHTNTNCSVGERELVLVTATAVEFEASPSSHRSTKGLGQDSHFSPAA